MNITSGAKRITLWIGIAVPGLFLMQIGAWGTPMRQDPTPPTMKSEIFTEDEIVDESLYSALFSRQTISPPSPTSTTMSTDDFSGMTEAPIDIAAEDTPMGAIISGELGISIRGGIPNFLLIATVVGIGVLLSSLAFIVVRKGWFSMIQSRTSLTDIAGRRAKFAWRTQRPQPGIAYIEGETLSGEILFGLLKFDSPTIGRAQDNNLVIDERFDGVESISRYHARIEKDGEFYLIVDLQSQNGIYVNGRRTRENILFDGTIFRLGQMSFYFRENKV